MARRKRSYKVPPFRQLNPMFGIGNKQLGAQAIGQLGAQSMNSMGASPQGFQPTMIRNETNMNTNTGPQTVGMPTNPDGSAFNKQQAMYPDQTRNNNGLIDPVASQAAFQAPDINTDVIGSSMEVATGQDMSKPIVDQNPQNKLEQLYKLS